MTTEGAGAVDRDTNLPRVFDWYDVPDESIEQGDLYFEFPLLIPKQLRTRKGVVPASVRSSVQLFDVIVMTQSCDLVNPGDDMRVMVCPVFDFEKLASDTNSGISRKHFDEIKKGRRPGVHLLRDCDLPGLQRGHMLVSFGQIFTTTYRELVDLADSSNRIRLLPPYREHLSQAFAKFVMRVGLPTDVGTLPARARA